MDAPEPRRIVPRPAPPPGLPRLRRRLADRYDFRDALLAGIAEAPDSTGTLGASLDVAGDATVLTLAELWSRVADSVAAYTELAAGEHYLGTAQDWTDLRRTTELLGHRPGQRTAARGWVRCLIDRGASPLVPAGTRVQAPGTPSRPAQTFEAATDTLLRADWDGLTVTAVPTPQPPPGRALRLLTDPGFATADQILLVAEQPAAFQVMPTSWPTWLAWIGNVTIGATAARKVVGTVTVTGRADDLGAFLITMDRPLSPLLAPAPSTTYAAYRIRATLGLAHRLDQLSYVTTAGTAATAPVDYPNDLDPAVTADKILVSDASAASPGIGIIVWNAAGTRITTVSSVTALDWSIAPGTKRQVGKITLTDPITEDMVDSPGLEIALVDARVVAQHYELPALPPGGLRLRIHPRPAMVPERLAIGTSSGWEMVRCSPDAEDSPTDTGGMLLVLGSPLAGTASAAVATANLVPVRHGTSKAEPLTLAGGTAVVPGPVTADVDTSGQVGSSLTVQVAGVAFEEVPSLYGRGPGELVYTTRLAADGQVVLVFGDGDRGAVPRGEVTARWRVGGGLEGELTATEIDALVGSVRGLRKVTGVGRTSGAADQEDPLRIRGAAAARIRALDRAVSLADLADLALTVPGTSHATAWRGAGPAGCPCGATGLHVASLRRTATGVRAPLTAELRSLAGYLDARRDTSVGLCVCAGAASAVGVTLMVATDPRREKAAVHEAVRAALTDQEGALAGWTRDLGVALDASDVVAVVHAVPAVVGVVSLALAAGLRAPSAAERAIGRTPAERYELLSVGTVTVVGP